MQYITFLFMKITALKSSARILIKFYKDLIFFLVCNSITRNTFQFSFSPFAYMYNILRNKLMKFLLKLIILPPENGGRMVIG